MIKHYPNCTAFYPEKPDGEPPQDIIEIDINDEVIRQCKDCGAFEVEVYEPKEEESGK